MSDVVERVAAAALVLFALACERSVEATATHAAAVSAAPAVSAAEGPRPRSMCDYTVLGEHNCYEHFSPLTKGLESQQCVVHPSGSPPKGVSGRFEENAYCPREDVVATCRLPDGSIRYAYAPQAVDEVRKWCEERSHGLFAASRSAPAPDASATVSCTAPGRQCREAVVVVRAEIEQRRGECASFERTFAQRACPRDQIVGHCRHVDGETLYYAPTHTLQSSRRACSEQGGVFAEPEE